MHHLTTKFRMECEMNQMVRKSTQRDRHQRFLVVSSKVLWRESLRLTIERFGEGIVIAESDTVSNLVNGTGDGMDTSLVLLHFDSAPDEDQARLQKLCEGLPEVPVVVVADPEDVGHIIGALSHGAKGYIPTTLDGRIMFQALCLVAAGGTYVPESILRSFGASSDMGMLLGRNRKQLGQAYRSCTERQREVLGLLSRGQPNKLIALELKISENTVKAHLREIMKRLDATNRTEVALIASGLSLYGDLANGRCQFNANQS